MIIDTISNAEKYYKLGANFKIGFEFLQNNDLKKLENGKYSIDGDNVYISVQDYMTKTLEESKFEAHRKYADIQFIIKGEEKLGYGDVSNFKPSTFYDDKNDIVFLDGNGEFVHAKENDFVIFMPADAHMPCVEVTESAYVKKAVVKVKI